MPGDGDCGPGIENDRSDKRELSGFSVELQTKVCEVFTITEKAPTRTLSLLKVPTGAH